MYIYLKLYKNTRLCSLKYYIFIFYAYLKLYIKFILFVSDNSNEVNDFINDLTPPEPLSKEVGVQVNIIKNTCTINKPKPSTRSKSSQCDLGLALTKTISSVKFGSVKHKEFDENSELESTLNSSLSNCDSLSNVSCSSSQSYIEEFFIENESNKYKKLSYEVMLPYSK